MAIDMMEGNEFAKSTCARKASVVGSRFLAHVLTEFD